MSKHHSQTTRRYAPAAMSAACLPVCLSACLCACHAVPAAHSVCCPPALFHLVLDGRLQ
ncbi:hypothetical protein K458DRAFT_67622 [Lentithecium fluviatile CBS 122367]|uniref:Uncharacterized protein n=1 Tax=Lentithecium fluviatile CBS 122367 TaxID=1168545 RepID=A0A6G1JLX1_9PLEO|nr:hypothetical protein K458DRAFT_67622 [Lentithecium fluviatile CBS 122367]